MNEPPDQPNLDPRELAKFEALASRWWDPHGEFKPLHQLNPVRTAFVAERTTLPGSRGLDIGCGGGLLTEALARAGARMTGIDLTDTSLQVARLHQQAEKLPMIEYRNIAAADLAEEAAGAFDFVACMEVLEHVPDPARLIADCARLVKPGGDVFLATINRSPKAFALAIVGAEYLLGMLPRGTHEYARFIRPSEIERWARRGGLVLRDIAGLAFNPVSGAARLAEDVGVNYLVHLTRPGNTP